MYKDKLTQSVAESVKKVMEAEQNVQEAWPSKESDKVEKPAKPTKEKPAKYPVKDKSGAVHSPMSRVRHLARMAMKKQMKEEVVDEALKGDQHKIDMNKNKKIDAQDFKLLRSKKGVAEEAEQSEEITEGWGEMMADVKRRHAEKESSFEKKKISTGTVYQRKHEPEKDSEEKPVKAKKKKSYSEMIEVIRDKGVKGLSEAFEKQEIEEEIEQLDELSVNKMLKYSDSAEKNRAELNKKWDNGTATQKEKEKVMGREEGEQRAADKIKQKTGKYPYELGKIAKLKYAITKEEIEQLDEVDQLARRGGARLNTTPAGKKREEQRNQARLKDKIKYTRSQGGIVGPKGKLPEEVEHEQVDEAMEKGIARRVLNKTQRKNADAIRGIGGSIDHDKRKAVGDKAVKKMSPKDAAKLTSDLRGAEAKIKGNVRAFKQVREEIDYIVESHVESFIDRINEERTLTEPESTEKERIVKGMKKKLSSFKDRYGDRAKEVMYATATARAKENK